MKNRSSKTPDAQNLPSKENRWIDLNCDVGESTGEHIVGSDQELIPLVTSANIACGAHGGDREHITNAVQIAVQHDVRIGAHPGYPDRVNFGRRAMDLSESQLADTMRQQLEFLSEITSQNGTAISYVKPHGALYHRCNIDAAAARVVVKTSLEFGDSMSIMGQFGTEFEQVCEAMGVTFIREAYADRRYLESGRLMPRALPGAVITDPNAAAAQVLSIATNASATTDSNHEVRVIGDSICVHGDSPNAMETLMIARTQLTVAGITIVAQI